VLHLGGDLSFKSLAFTLLTRLLVRSIQVGGFYSSYKEFTFLTRSEGALHPGGLFLIIFIVFTLPTRLEGVLDPDGRLLSRLLHCTFLTRLQRITRTFLANIHVSWTWNLSGRICARTTDLWVSFFDIASRINWEFALVLFSGLNRMGSTIKTNL
jgi:hypothetical protein